MEILLNLEAIITGLQTKRFGWTLYLFPEIDSTNERAKSLARQGAEEGTVILADSQSRGKGRKGHTFFSPQGGLYLSMLLRPALAPHEALPLPLLAGIAAAQSIRTLTGLSVGLRWPNDLLIHGKKIGGILGEMELKGGEIAHLVVGIGMNINTPLASFPSMLRPQITSLSHELHRPVLREILFCQLLHEFEKKYTLFLAQGPASLLEEWKTLAVDSGEAICLSDQLDISQTNVCV